MAARYTANNIAGYVVSRCIDDGHPISNLQLQKILYFSQVGFYAKFKRPRCDDDFEAWQYGPVIRDVYRRYFMWGGSKIRECFDSVPAVTGAEAGIAYEIAKSKRDLYPWDLVNETHSKGSPWDLVFNGGCGDGDVIPKNLIFESVS